MCTLNWNKSNKPIKYNMWSIKKKLRDRIYCHNSYSKVHAMYARVLLKHLNKKKISTLPTHYKFKLPN